MSSSSGSTIENVIIAALVIDELKKKERKKRKSILVKKWLDRRREGKRGLSLGHGLENPYSFRNYLNMNEECFDLVLSKIEGKINHQNTQFGQSVNLRDRLTVTLRYLATGESFKSLSYHFRLGKSTICRIVLQVLEAICECMHEENIKLPVTVSAWNGVEQTFRNKWNMPNCCGALAGKYINFFCPKTEETSLKNVKDNFNNDKDNNNSMVLMAIADGNYKFLCVGIETNESINDGVDFSSSLMSKYINSNKLNLPNNVPLPGTNICTPYVFVANGAFPLNMRIIKPFTCLVLSKEKEIFNFRLSRARSVVEDAFDIMANRFRVLLKPIRFNEEKVEVVTAACCILHNFLITNRGSYYSDLEDFEEPLQQLQSIHGNSGGNRATEDAIKLRNIFVDHFNNIKSVS